MRKGIVIGFLLITLAGCAQKNEGTTTIQDKRSLMPSGHVWAHAVFMPDARSRFLGAHALERPLLPLRESCGKTNVVWKIDANSLHITVQPSNVELLRTDRNLNTLLDAAFLPDCSGIIFLASRSSDQATDVYLYTIENKKVTQITQKLAPAWVSLESAKPSTFFLYPVDQEHVLLSAEIPNTGGDAITNQTIQGMLNLRTGIVTWIQPDDYGLMNPIHPVIFDDDKNMLSNFTVSQGENGHYSIIRSDTRLNGLEALQETVLSAENQELLLNTFYGAPSPSCIYENFVDDNDIAGYEDCMDSFWMRAFPRGNKTK